MSHYYSAMVTLMISDDHISWVPHSGSTILPDSLAVVNPGYIRYITRLSLGGGIFQPTYSYASNSYRMNADDTLTYVNSWEVFILESGVVSWYEYTPGDPLPPNAIATGQDADVTPLYSAMAVHSNQKVPGMYDPRKTYAQIPWGVNALHKNTFSILLFHKRQYA